MAALPSVDRAGIELPSTERALLPHENGGHRVTIRVDNYSHILSAYGDAAVQIATATVDLLIDQLRAGPCAAATPRPGLIELMFGQMPAGDVAGVVEAVIADLALHPVRLGDIDVHLALTCPALPEADRSTSSLPMPVCMPAGDDEDWAAQYRCDMTLAAQALAALDEGRLDLCWQAVRSANAPEQVLYHEGLARLLGRDGQLLSPGTFIPALERLGLVRAFDRDVFMLVLDELEHFPGARLGVNISAQSARLDGWWFSTLERLRAKPDLARRLVVEITETAALTGEVHRFASALRRLGCRIALDDFGVGHASVRNAMALSPDIIKVDAFFLRRAGMSEQSEALLEHLVGIAAHCAPVVIVEGVETAEQSRMAGRLQARYQSPANACWQQGYHFGRPGHWREWRHDASPEASDVQVVSLGQLAARPGTGFRAWHNLSGSGRAS
jgi:EAL domain-containing protein (putative c-di-GMP-specific phosphodiesterase class I)